MRRRTTGAMRVPEPNAQGESAAGKVTLARRLAEGGDIHPSESLDVDASTPESAAGFDAIIIVHPFDANTLAAAQVEMTLYVVDGSNSCCEAHRQLVQIVAGCIEGTVRLDVRNLTSAPLAPSETPLLAVPTLIVQTRHAPNRTGDIDPDNLLDFLAACGARRVSSC